VYLENLVVDAAEPQRLGRFWEAVLASQRLTDEPDAFETRLFIEGGPMLDVCFQRVPEPPSLEPCRLHVDLAGGAGQAREVERLLGLGARHADIDRGDVAGADLTDPEGNPCRVLDDRAAPTDTGPLAALRLDSGDPDTDLEFWCWLTGWVHAVEAGPRSLRHPSMRGPISTCAARPLPSGPRTGGTSTSGSTPATTPTRSRWGSPSAAAVSSSPGAASCRGGCTRTRQATSSACSLRDRDDLGQRRTRSVRALL